MKTSVSGTVTPWGRADQAIKIVPGVVNYYTPTHGGLRVAEKYLSPAAKLKAKKFSGGFRFEEDVQWVIPVYENYDTWGVEFFRKIGAQVQSKDSLKDTIEKWFPDYFSSGEIAGNAENLRRQIKNIKAGDKFHLDKIGMVYAVVGDYSSSSLLVKSMNTRDYGKQYKISKRNLLDRVVEVIPTSIGESIETSLSNSLVEVFKKSLRDE